MGDLTSAVENNRGKGDEKEDRWENVMDGGCYER